jgi:hypothetical protein
MIRQHSSGTLAKQSTQRRVVSAFYLSESLARPACTISKHLALLPDPFHFLRCLVAPLQDVLEVTPLPSSVFPHGASRSLFSTNHREPLCQALLSHTTTHPSPRFPSSTNRTTRFPRIEFQRQRDSAIVQLRYSVTVNISRFHREAPGSIPGSGTLFTFAPPLSLEGKSEPPELRYFCAFLLRVDLQNEREGTRTFGGYVMLWERFTSCACCAHLGTLGKSAWAPHAGAATFWYRFIPGLHSNIHRIG